MYRYRIVSDVFSHPDGGSYLAYGVACFSGEGGNAKRFACISNVSCDCEAVTALVALLNDGEVSPLHLADVVEDWLLAQELSPNFGTAPKD